MTTYSGTSSGVVETPPEVIAPATGVQEAPEADVLRSNPRFTLLCVRSNHVLTVVFFLGWAVVARFFPPPHPSWTAEQIVAGYQHNLTGIRVGCALMMASFGLWAIWGAVIAAWSRRTDQTRIMTYAQIISLALSEMIGVLCAFFWSMAAYRPGEISPDITLTLNDAGWLMFLLPWPPFAMWCVCVAVPIFRDRSPEPVFPRWVGFYSLLTAFLYLPALLPEFFKTGFFGYNGLLGMYVPLIVFFVWLEIMTHFMTRAAKKAIRAQNA